MSNILHCFASFVPDPFVLIANFQCLQEQQLCCQSRLLPSLYLKMQEVLVQEILKGSVGKKSDAHPLFNVDPSKVDKVYDIVTKKLGQHEEVANI